MNETEFYDFYADKPYALSDSLESTEWLLNWAGSRNFGFLVHGAFMACQPNTPAYYLYQLLDDAEAKL